MLVTFRTNAHASITMFGDVAQDLLKKMGLSGDIPSAILAEDIPAALSRLNEVIKKDSGTIKETKENAWDNNSISIYNRATPLVELLEAAAKEDCNVMWDKAGVMEPGISI